MVRYLIKPLHQKFGIEFFFSDQRRMQTFETILKIFLEGIRHFCGASDSPALDFW